MLTEIGPDCIVHTFNKTISPFQSADDWTVQSHDDLIKYRNQCVTKYDVSAEQVARFRAWNFDDTELTHNYIHCVFVKMGLFDDATVAFNEEHLFQQLTRNGADVTEVRSGIKLCMDEIASFEGAALKAFKGMRCFGHKYPLVIQESIKKA